MDAQANGARVHVDGRAILKDHGVASAIFMVNVTSESDT